MENRTFGIVVPCYNEEESVGPFLAATWPVLNGLIAAGTVADAFIVFVNDGSSDATLTCLRAAHDAEPRNLYVSFSRNFGKEAGLLAGMEKALAEGATHVAVMDADLQDPPALIPELFARMDKTGCDIVATYRQDRAGEPPVRSWFAHRFYGLMNSISSVELTDGARDFRLMDARVVRDIVSMPETERFSKGLFSWVGYETEWIGYENIEREHGTTSWSFWSLVGYALDGIVAFSVKPLMWLSVAGLVAFALALVFLLVIFFRALFFGDPVAGWPSLACIIVLFGSLQLLALGVIGMYLSKIYSEVKRRPVYLVAEQVSYER